MDAAELNNYPGGTMGESRRRRSWMSSSLTLPKAPSPQSRRRRRQPASRPLPAKKGIPALALPLCCLYRHGLAAQTRKRTSCFKEPRARSSRLASPAPGAAGSPGARRHRGGTRGQGRSGGGTSGENRSIPA